jgi:hypothetical protein
MKTIITHTLILALLVPSAQAQTLNESFENTTPLTDQQQVQANNYYHQGLANEVMARECKKLGERGCTDTSGKPGEVLGAFDEVLPKLYAVMGTLAATGSGAGKIRMRSTGGDAAASGNTAAQSDASGTGTTEGGQAGQTQDGQQPEKKESTDYCMFIPMAGEAISAATQKSSENQIQRTVTNAAEAQREGLYAVARTHTARARTATMQGTVYAGTAACYVAYLAKGADPSSPTLWLKMGAAVAMSAIFFKKAQKHKDYAKAVSDVAKKLPGLGECNPLSQTHCFCSQPSSRTADAASWNSVCVDKTVARNPTTGEPAICATVSAQGTATVDATCQCRRTNSCAAMQIGGFMGQVGLAGLGFNDPLRALDMVSTGLDDAQLTNFANGLNARSNSTLAGSRVGDIGAVALDNKGKGISDKLRQIGTPAKIADAIAGTPGGAMPAGAASAPAISSVGTGGNAPKAVGGANLPGYNAAGSASRSARQADAPPNPFAKFGAKNERPAAVQVETYAQQAVQAADVTTDTSRGLFEIISNRYRTSGWRQLEATPVPSNPAP